MQTKEKNNVLFLRLFPGEEVTEKIKEACVSNKYKSAVIVSGIGQLVDTKLGYFKEKGEYAPKVFKKPLELLTLSGNICIQGGECLHHIHATLGDDRKVVFGGHFHSGIVKVTAEIVIFKTNVSFERKIDEETGLQGMHLE